MVVVQTFIYGDRPFRTSWKRESRKSAQRKQRVRVFQTSNSMITNVCGDWLKLRASPDDQKEHPHFSIGLAGRWGLGRLARLMTCYSREENSIIDRWSYWPRKSWVSLGDGCKRWRHCVDLVRNGVAGRDTWRLSPGSEFRWYEMKILRHRLYPEWTLNVAWGGCYSNDNEPSSNGNKRLIKRSLKNKCRGLSTTTQCDYSRVPKSLW